MKKISILLLISFMMSCNRPAEVRTEREIIHQIFENNEKINELNDFIDDIERRKLGGLLIGVPRVRIYFLQKKNDKLWKTFDEGS